jgi:hypothetical protein
MHLKESRWGRKSRREKNLEGVVTACEPVSIF